MTTTTMISHPPLCRGDHSDLYADVVAVLGDYVDDFDVDRIVVQWCRAITDALPQQWAMYPSGCLALPAHELHRDTDIAGIISDAMDELEREDVFWKIVFSE